MVCEGSEQILIEIFHCCSDDGENEKIKFYDRDVVMLRLYFYINYFSIKDVFYTFAADKQIKD